MERIASLPNRPAPMVANANDDEERARIRTLLARVALFKDLSPEALVDVARRVSIRKVPMHASIIAQDEVGEALFVVFSGRAKVTLVAESGREVTLSVLRPGDF